LGIKIGKLQISAALKGAWPAGEAGRAEILSAFAALDEPVYLHQVIARQRGGALIHYPDMPQALAAGADPDTVEWRAHYHVPIFLPAFGALHSTRDAIQEVLALQ